GAREPSLRKPVQDSSQLLLSVFEPIALGPELEEEEPAAFAAEVARRGGESETGLEQSLRQKSPLTLEQEHETAPRLDRARRRQANISPRHNPVRRTHQSPHARLRRGGRGGGTPCLFVRRPVEP